MLDARALGAGERVAADEALVVDAASARLVEPTSVTTQSRAARTPRDHLVERPAPTQRPTRRRDERDAPRTVDAPVTRRPRQCRAARRARARSRRPRRRAARARRGRPSRRSARRRRPARFTAARPCRGAERPCRERRGLLDLGGVVGEVRAAQLLRPVADRLLGLRVDLDDDAVGARRRRRRATAARRGRAGRRRATGRR